MRFVTEQLENLDGIHRVLVKGTTTDVLISHCPARDWWIAWHGELKVQVDEGYVALALAEHLAGDVIEYVVEPYPSATEDFIKQGHVMEHGLATIKPVPEGEGYVVDIPAVNLNLRVESFGTCRQVVRVIERAIQDGLLEVYTPDE